LLRLRVSQRKVQKNPGTVELFPDSEERKLVEMDNSNPFLLIIVYRKPVWVSLVFGLKLYPAKSNQDQNS